MTSAILPQTTPSCSSEGTAGSAPDVEYLDLDGDGVPDAVRITERHALQCALDGRDDVAQVVVHLESGIRDDGVPAKIETTETLEIHLTSSHSDEADMSAAVVH